jgi:hypothetical protein
MSGLNRATAGPGASRRRLGAAGCTATPLVDATAASRAETRKHNRRAVMLTDPGPFKRGTAA